MTAFAEICGFATESSTLFKLSGHRYRVGVDGVRTLQHLKTMYEYCVHEQPNWSVASRGMIRDIERWNAKGVLSLVATQTRDPFLRRLAIWLRGRCRGTVGTASIATFAFDGEEATRKEVARALYRMSDWTTLARMASEDCSDRVRRLAAARPPRPSQDRLQGFLNNVSVPRRVQEGISDGVRLQRRPLYVAEHVARRLAQLFRFNPPKSAAEIRIILERIRRTVMRA